MHLLISSTAPPCLDSKNFLLIENENGSDVVLAVISKLQYLEILTYDYRLLLRRIALVETNDGTQDVSDGGIWALDETKFNMTVNNMRFRSLSRKLCQDLKTVKYASLRKPLISGLAATLYLYYLYDTENITVTENIIEQASIWSTHYHSRSRNLTEDDFVEKVQKRRCSSAVQTQVDQTLVEGANGPSVVDMVIAKISNIFDTDHRFLRRIAYVETNDGNSSGRPGGIWAVDECKLSIVLTASELVEQRVKIDQVFDIGLEEYSSLSKPLVSGLVARLYLYYMEITKNATGPAAVASAIDKQAHYWHKYYYSGNEGLTPADFIRKVNELEEEEGQYMNT